MISAKRTFSRFVLVSFALLAGFAPAAHAITADATIQVLDQLDVFSSQSLKRSTESPINLVDLNSVGTAALKSCQNGRLGLTCLDGQSIRNWKVPKTQPVVPPTPAADPGRILFSCEDDALALDVKNGACTSMTTDVKGSVWISGRKSSTSHNLIQLTRKVGVSCTSSEGTPLSGKIKGVTYSGTDAAEYCFVTRRSGRPLLLDISAFDAELATRYRGPGILGVESRKTVVFFPNDGSPVVEVGSGKNDWSLAGGEQVLSAALLQRELAGPAPTTVYTYGLITTSTGRVMWKNMAETLTPAVQIANVNSTVAALSTDTTTGVVSYPRGLSCEAGTTSNFFEIRASDTTGRLFFSNRNFCKLFAATPTYSGANMLTLIGNEIVPMAATYKPEGLSVSPGIAVDLAKCSALGCDYIKDGSDQGTNNNFAAASMLNVTLAPNSPAGLIVFQIKNIPDCREISSPDCVAGTVVDVPGKGKYLNVAPMLPQQIKDLFDTSGKKPLGLPPLLISPRYHAQALNGYVFDALFGVTDPNVVFRKSFTAQFDVGDSNLNGQKLGCGVFQKDPSGNPAPLPFQQWDIVTVVSERFTNVGGPRNVVLDQPDDPSTAAVDAYAGEHVDMLANKGCFNPTSGAGTRWSMYAFNLQLAESTETDINGALKYTYAAPRRYLGNLLKSLYTDLGDAQTRLACANVDAVANLPFDPGAAAPLSGSVCSTLAANWAGTQDKLFKCIDAATDPKVSQLDQNCGAFNAQFPSYQAYVQGLSPTGADPANRVGEISSRLDVIWHVYNDHFFQAPLKQEGAALNPY